MDRGACYSPAGVMKELDVTECLNSNAGDEASTAALEEDVALVKRPWEVSVRHKGHCSGLHAVLPSRQHQI